MEICLICLIFWKINIGGTYHIIECFIEFIYKISCY